MKTIGMLGGMSWESTVNYYRAINQGVKQELGGLHSAKISMYSVDFGEIEPLMRDQRWEDIAARLGDAARVIEAGGADFLMICTNTMHKLFIEIESAVNIPLLHIADATAAQLLDDGIGRVGLLGTAVTMEQDFYKGRLTEKFGIEVLVPEASARADVDNVIFGELCKGVLNDDSRTRYLEIIRQLQGQGAEAVILGCTEIAMLVSQEQTPVPLYDTTAIHAAEAVRWALEE